ncbi:MAG: sugar ABC transporter substrate-binding protein, partial [Pseudomonadota bacterium]
MNFIRNTLIAASLACAPAALAEDKITIGVANLFYGAPYFAGMDVAVHQEAEVFDNIEVISTDAGFDAAKMAGDIEDLIARGVDGLIISAGPTETIPSAMIAIEEAG